jgi:hypothetical protein
MRPIFLLPVAWGEGRISLLSACGEKVEAAIRRLREGWMRGRRSEGA